MSTFEASAIGRFLLKCVLDTWWILQSDFWRLFSCWVHKQQKRQTHPHPTYQGACFTRNHPPNRQMEGVLFTFQPRFYSSRGQPPQRLCRPGHRCPVSTLIPVRACGSMQRSTCGVGLDAADLTPPPCQ